MKVIVEAQIQGFVNCKDNGVHQVWIDSVSTVCQTLITCETLITRSDRRMTMSFSLGRYYELHIGKDNDKSDGCQQVPIPLYLRRGDALSADDVERSRDRY